MKLEPKDGAWTGEIFGDTLTFSLAGDTISISAARIREKECGKLTGRLSNGEMQASGIVYDQEFNFTAARAPARTASSAHHEFSF